MLHHNYINALVYSVCEVQYIAKRHNFASILSSVGPIHKSCTEITNMPTTSSKGRSNTRVTHLHQLHTSHTQVTHLTDASTEHSPTDSSTNSPNGSSEEPLTVPSTESSTGAPNRMTAPVSTAQQCGRCSCHF